METTHNSGVKTLCPEETGQRWADALRKRYPSNTVKSIARDFNAQPDTVSGWLKGGLPQQRHLMKAIDLHGPKILAEVYTPSANMPRARALQARLDTMAAFVEEVRNEIIAWEMQE